MKKLIEVISNLENIDEYAFLYAKRIDSEFSQESEVVILELTESEMEQKPSDIAEKKCSGFEYFMEVFLIKEFMEEQSKEYPTIEKKCDRLIHYVEFDA